MTSWQPGITLDEMERAVILQALTFYHGNRTRTALSLNIALRTLTSKLTRYKELGIRVPDNLQDKQNGQTAQDA